MENLQNHVLLFLNGLLMILAVCKMNSNCYNNILCWGFEPPFLYTTTYIAILPFYLFYWIPLPLTTLFHNIAPMNCWINREINSYGKIIFCFSYTWIFLQAIPGWDLIRNEEIKKTSKMKDLLIKELYCYKISSFYTQHPLYGKNP